MSRANTATTAYVGYLGRWCAFGVLLHGAFKNTFAVNFHFHFQLVIYPAYATSALLLLRGKTNIELIRKLFIYEETLAIRMWSE